MIFGNNDRFAEVIETSTTEYLAQCLQPDNLDFAVMPPFASWVKSFEEEKENPEIIYGVVYHVTTSPIDSVHKARALGMGLKQLRQEQPHIFALFQTEVRVKLLGFSHNGVIYQHLPSRPPQIHQGVYFCTPQEIENFTSSFHFLRSLWQATGIPTDELISAILRDVYQVRQCDRNWLVQAGRFLSTLLKDDYDRLAAILAQVHP
ncbi:MAG: hypothetical protein ACK421_01170 [Pseudanabaenaceae cyanobacterium]